MKKPFAAFDIDGTLVRWQLYHAVAEALAKAGQIDLSTHQHIRDARMKWKRRSHPESFRQYEHELVHVYEQLLDVLTVEQYEAAILRVFEEYKDQVYTYTRDLIQHLKAQGYLLFAISGSQSEIIAMIADHYGFDDFAGTIYERVNGRFTGKMATSVVGKKHEVLDSLIKKHGVAQKGSVAVGDSKSDIPMLEMVEQPIAFNPEQALFQTAREHNWKVVVERKNMVYELEPQSGTYVLAQANV